MENVNVKCCRPANSQIKEGSPHRRTEEEKRNKELGRKSERNWEGETILRNKEERWEEYKDG